MPVIRIFQIYSFSKLVNMQYSITNYIHHAIYYIPLITYYNWKFVHFEHLHLILPNSSSGNYKSDFFFCEFGFGFFIFCFVLFFQISPTLWPFLKAEGATYR